MIRRPRLLDLFCGAGGAAMGYYRAGFDVVGVDIKPQPRYPFRFVRADTFAIPLRLDAFDAIHASPPCQAYSAATAPHRMAGGAYPDLLADTRELLEAAGLPWVIENVPGAPMRADFTFCGCIFALPGLARKRWFETSWRGFGLRPPCYHTGAIISVCGHPGGMTRHYKPRGSLAQWREAMGIYWMTGPELAQAVPPAYTEVVGRELIGVVNGQ